MKILSALILISLFSCNQEKPKANSDTVAVAKAIDSMKAQVAILLMEYYSAGWMDGTNQCIELQNKNQFTNEMIENSRQFYWAKMRQQIASK